MIEIKLRDVLADDNKDAWAKSLGTSIYLVKYHEHIFYVGKSGSPIKRLMQHMGNDGRFNDQSSLGGVIERNMPESLDWSLCLYTVQECEDLVYTHVLTGKEEDMLPRMWYRDPMRREIATDFAELALIREHRPYLNVLGNEAKPLPEEYDRQTESLSFYLKV